MHTNTFLTLLFLGLLALVTASPAHIQKRSFKVERQVNPNFTGRNGPRALAKVYRKFGTSLPPGLRDALDAQRTAEVAEAKRLARRHRILAAVNNDTAQAANSTGQTGLVVTVPEKNDVEFISPVSIGGQTVNMDFDTGSSDLWVFSTALGQAATQGHRIFDPAASQSFKQLDGASFRIQYGDGSGALGVVGTDVVNVGGAVAPAQAVEIAEKVTQTFIQDQNNDGILGLAFSSINTVQPQQQKTFFDSVMPTLAEPVFTADLRKNAAGAYEFGRIDNTKFVGNALTWIPVNNTKGFWQFTSEKFAVDGGQVQMANPGGQAIADTGTTLILANPAVVQGYYSQVAGAVNDQQMGGVVFPCDSKMPDLQLDVGGVMATIKGDDIKFADAGQGACFGGLQATQGDSLAVYGDIFFKSQFVAFNGGNASLGLAPHA